MTGAEASALSQWLLLLRTVKQIGHAGFGLCSFEMTKMMAMKACCAGGVVALASGFSLLSTVSFLWLSLPCLSLVSSCLSFLVFLCSLLSFSLFPPLFLGQQPRLLHSLYMALFRKQILH